jgi:uncharacterized RDD family membrane protein YckC
MYGAAAPLGPLDPPTVRPAPPPRYVRRASRRRRASAALLDGLLLVAPLLPVGMILQLISTVPDVVRAVRADDGSNEQPGLSFPSGSAPVALLVTSCLAVHVWQLWRQAVTGRTLGKAAVGIRVVRERDGLPPGPAGGALRSLTHVLDVTWFGCLRPLWNAERKTFSDEICGSIVVSKH